VTRYLRTEQALRIARRAVGGPVDVRDIGLPDAAVRRPPASVLGQDAYPDLMTKAAALLHSLARNHALVDGDKRLAWLATYVFCAKNGLELDPPDDDAYTLRGGRRCRLGVGSRRDRRGVAALGAMRPSGSPCWRSSEGPSRDSTNRHSGPESREGNRPQAISERQGLRT
jgi:death on curing protein